MTEHLEDQSSQDASVDTLSSKKAAAIGTASMQRLEKALLPYEKQLQKQEAS